MPPVESAETLIAFGIVIAIVSFVSVYAFFGVLLLIETAVMRTKRHLSFRFQQENKGR